MSWFWGGGNKDKDKQNDPAKSLDADLKKFLDEQQPKPYAPTKLSTPPAQSESQNGFVDIPTLQTPDTNTVNEQRPLPKQSLYQDGRYAHLWKTYVPQSEIAAATENPIERLVNARKDRNSAITRAAMENCAFEQEFQQRCLGMGMAASLRSRMTMCQDETKTWNRCYSLQARFLKALGYFSDIHTTQEEEEKIQMHADKLYHRMMDYEADVDEAKREGKPIPPLASLFHPDRPAPTMAEIQLPQHLMDKLKSPLKDMPAHERELAARVAISDAKFGNTHADEFFAATTTMNEERKKRQVGLVKLFGEPIGKFFIPDAPEGTVPDPVGPTPQELEKKIWGTENATSAETDKSKTLHSKVGTDLVMMGLTKVNTESQSRRILLAKHGDNEAYFAAVPYDKDNTRKSRGSEKTQQEEMAQRRNRRAGEGARANKGESYFHL